MDLSKPDTLCVYCGTDLEEMKSLRAKWSVTANDQAQTIEALRAEVEELKGAEIKIQTLESVYRKELLALRSRIAALLAENEQGAKELSGLKRKVDDVEAHGRIMHESWTRTKRAQGFHHPSECYAMDRYESNGPCPKCHSDLIPWEQLPEGQKDINRHAFDDVMRFVKEGNK